MKKTVIAQIVEAIPAFQDSTVAVDMAAASILDINLTNLRCLGILLRSGPIAAKDIASSLNLTRGAITSVIDILENRGLVERLNDPNDRRGVLIAATPSARQKVASLWGPIRVEGEQFLNSYSESELKTIAHFLRTSEQLQERHAERIGKLKNLPGSKM
jgi:DNA-binding MarR family transcriptional regulator